MKNIIFISKDALRKEVLPVYGNTFFKTPNIDELAAKGTVFHRHYAAGGSTAMAFTAMSLGKYCYETGRKLYDGSEQASKGDTLFDLLYEKGYDVNIAWDDSYTSFAKTHFKCEGEHTKIHSLNSILPRHSAHITGQFDDLRFRNDETEKALLLVEELADSMAAITEKPVFLWFHLPHVFAGRNAYDSDIDVFDRIVGIFRQRFDDECIYIGADHGHMNGHKGKFSYGYDLDEAVMNIPLITPSFMGFKSIEFPTTATQMDEIFGLREFQKRDFIICETAYYAQPCRCMAIVHDRYKLIYNKQTKKYGLYDLLWDKNEEMNLFYPEFYDIDRHAWYSLNQRFYYPHWEEAHEAKKVLLYKMQAIWQNGTFLEEIQQSLLHRVKLIISKLSSKKKKRKITNIGK